MSRRHSDELRRYEQLVQSAMGPATEFTPTTEFGAVIHVMRAADWHLNESQPDHASSQPWGLLAFIWNQDARTLADQLLHSIQIQQPAGADSISSMLLADCLYCLPLIG